MGRVILATLVQIGGGWPFYVGAWQGLISKSSNMDTLVALGTTAAYLYSFWVVAFHAPRALYFETAAVLITFILIGKVVEMRAKRKARHRCVH